LDLYQEEFVVLFQHLVEYAPLVLEVFVDKPFGNPGCPGYFCDGDGGEVPLFQKLAQGLEDLSLSRGI